MENMTYLFSAFTISWVILFAYIIAIFRRQTKLEHRLESMKKLLEVKKQDNSL